MSPKAWVVVGLVLVGCSSSVPALPTGDAGFDAGPSGTPDAGDAGPTACIPTTCAALSANCGPQSDGCGGLIDGGCGSCTAPDTCGGGGSPSRCGNGCVPRTCAEQGISCGPAGDGCGNTLNCYADGGSACPTGEVCGGDGRSKCGAPPVDAGACVPKTCALNQCGPTADGCGNTLACGGCDAGLCGDGKAFFCGDQKDGGFCKPLTCADQAISCGLAGDGCGGSLVCGKDGGVCPSGQSCEEIDGGAIACVVTGSLCVPLTCADQGVSCGTAGDGCGGLLTCSPLDGGACADGGVCETIDGGAGAIVTCEASDCTPTTCAALNANCGEVANGCGGLLDCNATDAGCVSPQFCGGGGPNLCGYGYESPDGGSYVSCAAGSATSLRGVAYAATNPADFTTTVTPDPIPGAYIWVPSDGRLPPITPGITCTQCATPPTALVLAITNADGAFTLPNVPVVTTAGQATVPLIVQVGRWARLITVNVMPCQPNTVPQYALRLPRTSEEGNLPWFAVDTGSVDALECVLLKMGVDPSMFAAPAQVVAGMNAGGVPADGGARIAIYTSPDTLLSAGGTTQLGGALAPDGTDTSAANLYGDLETLSSYDAVLFPCAGGEVTANKAKADIQNVVQYADNGGRMFADHFSYVWLYDDSSDAPTAAAQPEYGWGCTTGTDGTYAYCNTAGETVGLWEPQQTIANDISAQIDTSRVDSQTFGQWMVDVGAGTLVSGGLDAGVVGAGTVVTFSVSAARWDLGGLQSDAEAWDYLDSGTPMSIQQMSFRTPLVPDAGGQCGRVMFSDFHVNNTSSNGESFPTECTFNGGTSILGNLPVLSAQERALEYQLLTLVSCVPPATSTKDTCVAKSCADYPAGTCGQQSDGCGGVLNCTTCTGDDTCGGGGVPNQCGTTCTPRTCASGECGTQSDGCGGTLACATCDGGDTCGGGGVPSQCGKCVPKTCADYPNVCGEQADGCGGLTANCNPCALPAICGGAGVQDACGVPDGGTCVPKSCSAQDFNCGEAGDGCGNALSCGSCDGGETCGGGGVPDKCGGCTPLTCAAAGVGCGTNGDGCGGQLSCPCTAPEVCGGGGPGVCGVPCTPTTCGALGVTCGYAGDGCGALLACGSCDAGQICVAGSCTSSP